MKKIKLIIFAGKGGGDFVALEHARNAGLISYELSAFFATDAGSNALEVFQKNYHAGARIMDDFRARKDEHFSILMEELAMAAFDYVLLCGFTFILPPQFIRRFAGKIVNSHHSILPAHPGLFRKEKLLTSGDLFLGATIHEVDEGVDTGKMLSQCVFPNPGMNGLDQALRMYRFAQDCMSVQWIRNAANGTSAAETSYMHEVLFRPAIDEDIADLFIKKYFPG